MLAFASFTAEENASEAAVVSGVDVYGVKDVSSFIPFARRKTVAC